jgi:hypothetical protein
MILGRRTAKLLYENTKLFAHHFSLLQAQKKKAPARLRWSRYAKVSIGGSAYRRRQKRKPRSGRTGLSGTEAP